MTAARARARRFDQRRSATTVAQAAREGFGVRKRRLRARAAISRARKASFAKPAKPGNGGKVFVPRDIKKRPYKPAN